MNKTELIAAVAEKTGCKKTAAAAYEAAIAAITDALAKGEKVALPGFGTLEVRERAAHTGRNPLTGETIEVAASKNVAFKAGAALKAKLQ